MSNDKLVEKDSAPQCSGTTRFIGYLRMMEPKWGNVAYNSEIEQFCYVAWHDLDTVFDVFNLNNLKISTPKKSQGINDGARTKSLEFKNKMSSDHCSLALYI
jgi:hypothetical protein